MKEKVNIHLYQSPFQHESRILRITGTLAHSGHFDQIYIMATWLEGLPEVEHLDDKRTVFRIKTIISPAFGSFTRYIFLLEWTIRILLKFRKKEVLAVNPHSVPTLPVAWIFKKLHGSLIIYDTHEIETEQYSGNGLKKRISKFLESTFIGKVDYLFATSDGYADWYRKTYGLNAISVVKNYSLKRDNSSRTDILRRFCKLEQEDILFIYQGIIAYGRGIEYLLDIFSKSDKTKHIVFMGFGPETDVVKDFSLRCPNIHYHPPVKPSEVYLYVSSCDVGFCIIENLFISYYYTLPNKLLECLNVGVPVIVSDFPDMKRAIDDEKCGWSTGVSTEEIGRVINGITREAINKKRHEALLWAEINTWESQEKILLADYDRLLFKH